MRECDCNVLMACKCDRASKYKKKNNLQTNKQKTYKQLLVFVQCIVIFILRLNMQLFYSLSQWCLRWNMIVGVYSKSH